MTIDRERAKADGFTDQEIAFVESYLDQHPRNGTAALVVLGKRLRWVSQSVAEAVDQLRPGCWLREDTEEALKLMSRRRSAN